MTPIRNTCAQRSLAHETCTLLKYLTQGGQESRVSPYGAVLLAPNMRPEGTPPRCLAAVAAMTVMLPVGLKRCVATSNSKTSQMRIDAQDNKSRLKESEKAREKLLLQLNKAEEKSNPVLRETLKKLQHDNTQLQQSNEILQNHDTKLTNQGGQQQQKIRTLSSQNEEKGRLIAQLQQDNARLQQDNARLQQDNTITAGQTRLQQSTAQLQNLNTEPANQGDNNNNRS